MSAGLPPWDASVHTWPEPPLSVVIERHLSLVFSHPQMSMPLEREDPKVAGLGRERRILSRELGSSMPRGP